MFSPSIDYQWSLWIAFSVIITQKLVYLKIESLVKLIICHTALKNIFIRFSIIKFKEIIMWSGKLTQTGYQVTKLRQNLRIL